MSAVGCKPEVIGAQPKGRDPQETSVAPQRPPAAGLDPHPVQLPNRQREAGFTSRPTPDGASASLSADCNRWKFQEVYRT